MSYVNIRKYTLPLVLAVGGLAGIGSRVYNCEVGENFRNIPEVTRYISLEKELENINISRTSVNNLSSKLDKSPQIEDFLKYLNQRQDLIQTEIRDLESNKDITCFRDNRDSSDSYGGLVFGAGMVLIFTALGSFFEELKGTK